MLFTRRTIPNALKAVVLWVTYKVRGLQTEVDIDTQFERLRSCLRCPYMTTSGQCEICTCYVDLKSRFTFEYCPHPERNLWL